MIAPLWAKSRLLVRASRKHCAGSFGNSANELASQHVCRQKVMWQNNCPNPEENRQPGAMNQTSASI